MTLTELANKLREIFDYKYLTVERPFYNLYFCMWSSKPHWNGKYWDTENDGEKHIIADFLKCDMAKEIDISEEYRDADGNIDFSKCIVEVTNDL